MHAVQFEIQPGHRLLALRARCGPTRRVDGGPAEKVQQGPASALENPARPPKGKGWACNRRAGKVQGRCREGAGKVRGGLRAGRWQVAGGRWQVALAKGQDQAGRSTALRMLRISAHVMTHDIRGQFCGCHDIQRMRMSYHGCRGCHLARYRFHTMSDRCHGLCSTCQMTSVTSRG